MDVKKYIEQAKTLLFSFRELVIVHAPKIPCIMLFLHFIGMVAYVAYFINGSEPEVITILDKINHQLCDASGITFILLLATSKHYKKISWLAYCILILLWITTLVYVLTDTEPNIYFIISICIIYIIFVVGAVKALTSLC